ncbi:hypothetical protein PAXRUDRAFT_180961 [Paxillus rubicundulus Ve08.2h10]|uniref:Uncharacterized protein n=1 Tax=Paxillus rubicundulus Ve08.2h10 TaxID=930991 RepID=A0A0D0CNI7_9AGAM|nr:hypothetical protein PAXRUDRAFT_180961 [Paxillus rubicundulus Ve08.2h10]
MQGEADQRMANAGPGHPERSRANWSPTSSLTISPVKKKLPVALPVDQGHGNYVLTTVSKGKAAHTMPAITSHAADSVPVASSSTLPAPQEGSDHTTFRSWIKEMAALCRRNDKVLHPETSYANDVFSLGHYFARLMDLQVQLDRETQESFLLLADETLMRKMTRE